MLRKYAGGYRGKSTAGCFMMITGSVFIVLLIIRYCRLPIAVMTAVWLASGIMICLFAPVQDRNNSLDEVEQIIYRRRAIAIWIAESVLMWVLYGSGFIDEGKGILFGNGFTAMLMLAEQIGRVLRIESPCAKYGIYVECTEYRMYSRIRTLLVSFGISAIAAGFCCQHFPMREQKPEPLLAVVIEACADSERHSLKAVIEACADSERHSLKAVIEAHADSERRAGEFLRDTISDISCQLKAPVAALKIYHNNVLQELGVAAAAQKPAVFSEREPGRTKSLGKRLLNMARLKAGAVVLKPEPENLSELLEHIGQQYSFRARQEGKEIQWKGDDKVILFCDRLWVQEAIGNLVKNALDHTKPGDRIVIRWQQSPCLTQIIIEDTGNGIHPKGPALGLFLAKAMIKAHYGSVEVRSRPGQGTAFTVSFPAPDLRR